MTPRHNGYGRYRVLWGTFDQAIADRNVDKRVPLLINRSEDVSVLEKQRRAFRVHFFIGRQLRDVGADWADLPAGNRKA